MTDDPLDAMKARWSYIQGFLFPWMREDNDPITEALGRLVTTLDVIGLEAFVPEPPRGPGRPPEDRRALARAFVAKAVLGVPTTSALIERLDVDKSLRRILGWERRSVSGPEPDAERRMTAFHDGADQEAGLAATRTALQNTGSGDDAEGLGDLAAMRADKTVRPTGAPKIGSTCRVIGKQLLKLRERLGKSQIVALVNVHGRHDGRR